MTIHTNIAIVEGEVLILSTERINENDSYLGIDNKPHLAKEGLHYMAMAKNLPKIIATTAKLEGIPQLDRKHFVKPKVDVEELAREEAEKEGMWDSDSHIGFTQGYIKAYNAKEAEFTRQDMEAAYAYGVAHGYNSRIIDGFNKFINELHPLSLPKSVTLNENNEITNVQW